MPTKEELQSALKSTLDETIRSVNSALRGEDLGALRPVLSRIGRGQQLPHWYEALKASGALPNLDGKTVGSVIEMVLVAVLETFTFRGMSPPPLRISPARGVDLPDLDLGVKSPSKNYCTSEPFFSAYERILGSDHDVLVLITDYQEAKKKPPLRLQITSWKYLTKTQVADHNLCRIASKHRPWMLEADQARAKRVIRFLAYVNQSDWRARRLLTMIDNLDDESKIEAVIKKAAKDFPTANKKRMKDDKIPIPESELAAILGVLSCKPLQIGVIDAADNWVVDVCKDAARAPSGSEWSSFVNGPLDGKIGMSLALQWRYNFGRVFGKAATKRLKSSSRRKSENPA